jgi:hypothetical protein
MTSLIIAFAAGLLVFVAVQAAIAWRRWRGTRLITCPETRRPAAVEVDLSHAVLGSLAGRPDLRLRDCTRWPERRTCGQTCLMQIEESPGDCLVRVMLERWYEGRSCVYCAKPFDVIRWHDHRPGLRAPDGRLREWSRIRPETLREVLASHEPVCWNCLMTEGFRKRFPELVVERPPHPGSHGTPPPA